MRYPENLKYTKEHAWVRLEGGEAVIGITDHAQKELGDIVFIELPGVGAELTRLKPYGVVESVKSVSDLIAPVGGSVVRVNEVLRDMPETVNKDPYDAGWIAAASLTSPSEAEGLMSAAEYEAFVAEIGR